MKYSTSAIWTVVFYCLLAPMVEAQEPPQAPAAPRARLLAERAAMLAPMVDIDGNRSTQAFQVTLLLASSSGSSSPELPKVAREAVEGLKDFLPYTSYEVLDFAWIRTAGIAQTRINGPDDRAFDVRIRYDDPEENEGKIFIRSFSLENAPEEGTHPTGQNIFVPSSDRLISTSFGMEIGETVVVGTSRLNGAGKALVVLLTAIPASVAGS